MSQKNQKAQDGKKPMDLKKIVIIAVVTLVVILAAVMVDNAVRNPKCEDETAALNVVIQKVLPALDELADDEGFSLDVQEMETIGDAQYYPVFVIRYPKCEDSSAAKRIVEERVLPGLSGGSQAEVTYLRNETIEDYVYFVNEVSRITGGKKEVLSTVYVREHNSQPFVKDAEGKLAAAADEVEDPIATVYVRIKDSQPFHKDDTTGQLVPYGG